VIHSFTAFLIDHCFLNSLIIDVYLSDVESILIIIVSFFLVIDFHLIISLQVFLDFFTSFKILLLDILSFIVLGFIIIIIGGMVGWIIFVLIKMFGFFIILKLLFVYNVKMNIKVFYFMIIVLKWLLVGWLFNLLLLLLLLLLLVILFFSNSLFIIDGLNVVGVMIIGELLTNLVEGLISPMLGMVEVNSFEQEYRFYMLTDLDPFYVTFD
jgi:hypothetical protein